MKKSIFKISYIQKLNYLFYFCINYININIEIQVW